MTCRLIATLAIAVLGAVLVSAAPAPAAIGDWTLTYDWAAGSGSAGWGGIDEITFGGPYYNVSTVGGPHGPGLEASPVGGKIYNHSDVNFAGGGPRALFSILAPGTTTIASATFSGVDFRNEQGEREVMRMAIYPTPGPGTGAFTDLSDPSPVNPPVSNGTYTVTTPAGEEGLSAQMWLSSVCIEAIPNSGIYDDCPNLPLNPASYAHVTKVVLAMKDVEVPAVAATDDLSTITGWTNRTDSAAVTVTGTDIGSGVKAVSLAVKSPGQVSRSALNSNATCHATHQTPVQNPVPAGRGAAVCPNIHAQTGSDDLSKLTEGDNIYTATATDLSGQTASSKFTVQVDRTAPTGLAASGLPTGWIGASNAVSIKAGAIDVRSGVTGLSVKVGNRPAGTTTFPAIASGQATIALDLTGVPNGTQPVYLTATDAAGNTTTAKRVGQVKLDRTPPSIGTPRVTRRGKTVTITASAHDTYSGLAKVEARTGPTDATLSGWRNAPNGRLTLTTAKTLAVEMRATDKAGNASSTVSGAVGAAPLPRVKPPVARMPVPHRPASRPKPKPHKPSPHSKPPKHRKPRPTGHRPRPRPRPHGWKRCCATKFATWGAVGVGDQVVYGDFDGDGVSDVLDVVSNGQVSDLMVSLSDGSRFLPARRWGTVAAGVLLRSGDVDGDGYEDLAYAIGSPGHQQVEVLSSTGSDLAGFSAPAVWGLWDDRFDLRLADVDGDEFVDAVGYDVDSGQASLAYSAVDSFLPTRLVATVAAQSRMFLGDVNNDDMADLVAYEPNTRSVSVALVQESGNDFEALRNVGKADGRGVVGVGDMDGDGMADMVLRVPSSGRLDVLRATRTGGFASRVVYARVADRRSTASAHVAGVGGSTKADVVARAASGELDVAISHTASAPDRKPKPYVPHGPYGHDALTNAYPKGALDGQQPGKDGPELLLGWADEAQLRGDDNTGTDDAAMFAGAAARIKEAGARTVRMVVTWGRWLLDDNAGDETATTGYVAQLRASVNRARKANFGTYLTLTGANYPANKITGTNPNPKKFGDWVHTVVAMFAKRGVHMYGIWNEPNGTLFLKVPCPSAGDGTAGRSINTAPLYARLWSEGEHEARDADPHARVFLGEFSSAPTKYIKCNGDRDGTTMTTYLRQTVNDAGMVKTDGVAWHPYQPLPGWQPAPGSAGIGAIAKVRTVIDDLSDGGHGNLRTPNGKVPGSFLTEFGYLNRPLRRINKKKPKPFLSERERTTWFPRVLDLARDNGARMLLFWQLKELEPNNTKILDSDANLLSNDKKSPNAARFDTGMVGAEVNDKSEPTGKLLVGGLRDYSKTGPPECRGAYLAIRRWADNHGYPALGLSDPQPEPCA